MRRYITREDAVFAACKVLDKFGGCKMGLVCPDVGCSEVRDIIDTFQMIEIPEKHGRLIDADALTDSLRSILNDPNCPLFVSATVDQIVDCAPTIIQAEEGE